MNAEPVVIIGAGLAGLCCARRLAAKGIPYLLLEGADAVGGRVRTDKVDGFLLDRGFQVLQTAYPEARAILDYAALKLHAFDPGATIRTQGRWANMIDPGRRPATALQTLFNGVGNFADRWRLLQMKRRLTGGRGFDGPDVTTQEYLAMHCRFSNDFIDRFMRPWISGMFFDDELRTSSHFFQFVFRMLSIGDASIPAEGMEAIPKQLASELNPECIRLNSPVARVDGNRVLTSSGESINAKAVVIATDAFTASQLTGGAVTPPSFGSTACYYFAANRSPKLGKLLALSGDWDGPISNVSVPSNVAPSYAPENQSLICVSIRNGYFDQADLMKHTFAQLASWFGSEIKFWRMLQRYDVPRAIPFQSQGKTTTTGMIQLSDQLFLCGDYLSTASINGAMHSGIQVAEALIKAMATNN